MMSNAPKASGLSGTSHAAGDRRVDRRRRGSRSSASPSATAPDAHELAVERIGPRTSRAIPRLAGAAPPNTASARFGATGLDPALEVALVLLLGVGDPAERAAEVDPDPLAGARRRASPGRSPASSRASRPATSPNWLNRSSWRAVFGGIQASGSKSSTWAATWQRNGDGSNRSIRLTGERPARSPARNASTPVPIAVITPIPVIQTSRRSLMSMGSSDRARRTSSASDASASASAPNVASVRPAIGRVNSRSTSQAQPGTRGAEVVVDLDAAAGDPGVLDPPGHVHPVRRPAAMEEPEAPPVRLGPGQRLPGDRQPEPEHRHERPAGDEADREPAVGVRRGEPGRGDVVGEQARPALDVAGEPEDERRPAPRRRSRSCCSRRRPLRDRRGEREVDPEPADLDEPERRRAPSRREPAGRVRRAVDLVAQGAADDPDVVQHADEVEVAALRGGRPADRRARRRPAIDSISPR